MKKVLLVLTALTFIMNVNAQNIQLNENKIYEKKVVEKVDSVVASELYLRALEALSDWVGVDGKSSYGIDHQDKESGTIIFKGKDYLGYRNFVLGAFWSVWSEFTLKIRCKDGRAQIVVSIPSLWLEYSANATAKTSVALSEITPEYTFNAYRCKKACLQYINSVPESADRIITIVKEKLHQEADNF
jgi:hypothetical protein